MSAKMSKRTKKQLINIAVLVVLIAATLITLFVSQDIDLGDIFEFVSNCNPWFIVAAFGGMLGYVLFEAISLHIIARTLGHKSKVTASIAYSASDLYYSAITPSASGGQPASAFYMMRDGMSGGTAGFTVLFNIISYTVATILVGLFGVVACPSMFGQIGHWFAQTLVIIGFVIQILLLALLLLCLFRARVILAIGNWGISVLAKIRIVKKADKWRGKLEGVVTKYRACRSVIKKHPMLFLNALVLNTAQRASQTLIPCFVIMASPLFGATDVTFLELFCMQAYVMIGYNSIPLPGGTGVYEYLYPNIYGIGFPDMTFVLSAMMVSRGISYYISMIVTGLYTLVYHAVGIRKIKGDPDDDPMATDLYEAVKQSLPPDGDTEKETAEETANGQANDGQANDGQANDGQAAKEQTNEERESAPPDDRTPTDGEMPADGRTGDGNGPENNTQDEANGGNDEN